MKAGAESGLLSLNILDGLIKDTHVKTGLSVVVCLKIICMTL